MKNTLVTNNGTKIPKSPFNLLQEIYIDDPWKILVCCILLNQTKRKQVDGIRDSFFEKWPNAKSLSRADVADVAKMIKSLGFYNRRSKTLIEFSKGWTDGQWKSPTELKGIGKYAMDSWEIFVNGKIVKKPTDHVLNDYIKWRRTKTSCSI